jgi:hypothetical protein
MIQITDREGCAFVDNIRPVIVWAHGPGYPDRFMELFARRGEPATVVNGAIFKLYSRMVVPFGPADAGLWGLPQRGLRALTQIRARSGGNSRSAHRS